MGRIQVGVHLFCFPLTLTLSRQGRGNLKRMPFIPVTSHGVFWHTFIKYHIDNIFQKQYHRK